MSDQWSITLDECSQLTHGKLLGILNLAERWLLSLIDDIGMA